MLVIASMKSLNGAEQKQHINSVEVDIFFLQTRKLLLSPYRLGGKREITPYKMKPLEAINNLYLMRYYKTHLITLQRQSPFNEKYQCVCQ
jgi:hypothetical protein